MIYTIATIVVVFALIAFGRKVALDKLQANEAKRLANIIKETDKIERKLDETIDKINSGGIADADIGSMLSTYHDTQKH